MEIKPKQYLNKLIFIIFLTKVIIYQLDGYNLLKTPLSKKLSEKDILLQAAQFLMDISNRSLVYRGSNIAVALGDDFNFQAANMYFSNIDRLIK